MKKKKEYWLKDIRETYRIMRKKSSSGAYSVNILGTDIVVHPDVYAPDFFSDTAWFSSQLIGIVGDKTLLEIGTGTGTIGLICALNGASVVATDINEKAITNATENAKLLSLDVPMIYSDVFEGLSNQKRFDFIFWSHPFNNVSSPVDDVLLRSGMDYKYGSLEKYISAGYDFLKDDGRLLLGSGDSADLEEIIRIAHDHHLSACILRVKRLPFSIHTEETINYFIFEFRKEPS